MAVYSKLLLSAGGGIVSTTQQADQAKNTATLLIGLGGTGIDCLRTIKTQVHSRLKPDDPEDVSPKYEHIRFLGVDTAEKSKGDQEEEEEIKAGSLMALDDTECFSISNPHVKRAFSNAKGLEMREELSWLRWDDIEAPDLGKAGAGGIRQIGRYMMMDKSKAFMSRVEQEINAAKAGLIDPTVNVHIFTGLSGGTAVGAELCSGGSSGSGCVGSAAVSAEGCTVCNVSTAVGALGNALDGLDLLFVLLNVVVSFVDGRNYLCKLAFGVALVQVIVALTKLGDELCNILFLIGNKTVKTGSVSKVLGALGNALTHIAEFLSDLFKNSHNITPFIFVFLGHILILY